MEKQISKPVMYNSYKCDETVVRVNEYSTISAEWVSQMVSVDFPVQYNCIRVELHADSDHIETLLEDFVDYCEPQFSVVLIQRVGFDSALLSLFSSKDLQSIYFHFFDFERFYVCSFEFKITY